MSSQHHTASMMLPSVTLLKAHCQLLSMHACASSAAASGCCPCCTALLQVIITTNYVLVMNPEDENVLPFITELKMKISQPSGLAGVRSTAHCVYPQHTQRKPIFVSACVRPQIHSMRAAVGCIKQQMPRHTQQLATRAAAAGRAKSSGCLPAVTGAELPLASSSPKSHTAGTTWPPQAPAMRFYSSVLIVLSVLASTAVLLTTGHTLAGVLLQVWVVRIPLP